MRILVLDTYYDEFQQAFYVKHTGLAQSSYDEQRLALMDECFGTADFYSSNLVKLGHEATELIINSEPLQRQWASENGVRINDNSGWRLVKRKRVIPWLERVDKSNWFYGVLSAQIRQYRPDVLYVQDMNSLKAGFLREMKPYVRLIVGQIACPVIPEADFNCYDLVLSSFPHFVRQFRQDGLKSEYLKLGFEPKVLERVKKADEHNVVFIGSLSDRHAGRVKMLEKIAASVPLRVWGYGAERLAPTSSLKTAYQGGAWALDMYQILSGAKIAINHHIDLAQSYANNMRLFEATGVGTLLVTDDKTNLSEMFQPGREVAAYRSSEECLELIEYYLDHPAERQAIAGAGQARTLAEHTYYHRMQELVEFLSECLSSRKASRRTVSRPV